MRGVPLSASEGCCGGRDSSMLWGGQVRGGELGHFGAEADVGDLLQFPPQALLPLGQAHPPDLVPGLAGVQLGGQVGPLAGLDSG